MSEEQAAKEKAFEAQKELLAYQVSDLAYDRLKRTCLIWAGAIVLVAGIIGYKAGDLLKHFEDQRKKINAAALVADEVSKLAEDVKKKAGEVNEQFDQLQLQEDSLAKSSIAVQEKIQGVASSLEKIIAANLVSANPQQRESLENADKQIKAILKAETQGFVKFGNLESGRWSEQNFDLPPERQGDIPKAGDILRARTTTFSRSYWPNYVENKGLILAPAAGDIKPNEKIRVISVEGFTLKNGIVHYWVEYAKS